MPPIIPQEEILAIEPWRADRFDAPPPVAVPEPEVAEIDAGEPVPEFTLPTAEDIERIHNEAHAAGFAAGQAEGREQGYETGLQEARAEAERLRSLADNLQQSLSALDQDVAEALLELAMETARQVVRCSLQLQPEAILTVIREAVAALPLHHGGVILHVNPADAPLVREHLINQATHQPAWHLIEDHDIATGGCFIRAGHSEIDATVATRWRHVLEAIGAPATDAP